MILFAISRGPGTLVEEGQTASRGEAMELFDEYVIKTIRQAQYWTDDKLEHTAKGHWSITTMPEGYAGPPA